MLTPNKAHQLRELCDDTDMPKAARAALADMLDRNRAAAELLAQVRADHGAAQAAYTASLREQPSRVIAALASPPVPLALIDGDLAELREQLDRAAVRQATVERASKRLVAVTERCLLDHASSVLGYVAAHRAAVPMTGTVPDRVQLAWAMAGRRVAVHLPVEALVITGPEGHVRLLSSTMRIALDRTERHYWAWCAINAGQAQVASDGGAVRVTVTADWHRRAELYASDAPRQLGHLLKSRKRTAAVSATT